MTETDDSPLVDSPAACPLCGGEVYRRHRAGDGYLPECWWWECEQCGEAVRGPE